MRELTFDEVRMGLEIALRTLIEDEGVRAAAVVDRAGLPVALLSREAAAADRLTQVAPVLPGVLAHLYGEDAFGGATLRWSDGVVVVQGVGSRALLAALLSLSSDGEQVAMRLAEAAKGVASLLGAPVELH